MTRRDDYIDAYWVRNIKLAPGGKQYANPPGERFAVVRLKSRTGIQYTREVKSSGYVTQREAAKLLCVSVMTINRWVRQRTVKSTKRQGVSMIAVRDLAEIADENGIAVSEVRYPALKKRRTR